MSEILIKQGSVTPPFQLVATSPWSIRFRNADDLLMPFDGNFVLPSVAGTAPDFALTGEHEWLFLSLRYPQATADNSRRFPNLRDMFNRPVVTKKSVILFVANDHSLFDDFHISNLFSDIKNSYDPVFKNNYAICTLAKYFLIEFDEGVFSSSNQLPTDVQPFACKQGFGLKTNDSTDTGLSNLSDVLLAAGDNLNGTIRAFDFSGRETETYSALLNLGIEKTLIENAPDDNAEKILKVQFVDIHGEVMYTTVFPLEYLDFDPVPVLAPGFEDLIFYQFSFSTTDRKIKFKLKPEGSILSTIPSSYHFHHIAFWPGYDFRLKEIKSDTTYTEINLLEDIDADDHRRLTFARICVFHPLGEFQVEVGGDLVDKSYLNAASEKQVKYKFKNNDLYAFTTYNKVTPFNCGADFFKDYQALVFSLKEKDRLYQANWSSHPFVHLTGSRSVRKITSNDLDADSINAQLSKSRDEFLLLPVSLQTKGMQQAEWRVVYMPSLINGNEVFTMPLATEIWTIPGPGEFSAQQVRGFVRPSSMFAWLLKPIDTSTRPVLASGLLPHRVLAYWKNALGLASATSLENILQTSAQEILFLNNAFPVGAISIETNGGDPPSLQIRRLQPISSISSEGDTIRLLVINLNAGVVCLLPLNPPSASATSSDVILTNATDYGEDTDERNAIELLLNSFSAEDQLLFAVCKAPATPQDSLQSLLITDLWPWHFSNDAIRTGDVPMHIEEVGGLFRHAISNKVVVRALYWEQYLAAFSPGDNLLRGLSNNESISNIINKPIGGNFGFALRDRATRDFGSWHQKSSVIIQKDPEDVIISEDKLDLLISYLGGMDLGMGRYDTQLHFEHDPDRQAGMWYDVHVKIEGEAGFDVLRNFGHRWKANAVFLGSDFEKYRAVNISTDLTHELQEPFNIPDPAEIKAVLPDDSNAFVQINRTIPPRSCLSLPLVTTTTSVEIPEIEGELGSLASYTKAYNMARKFIIINEQYFFSQEMALILHDCLAASDGPEFLILVLPIKLDESAYIDPNIFQLRKLAIDTLYYGAEVGAIDASGSRCGKIAPHGPGDSKVKNKVAIMTPVNTDHNLVNLEHNPLEVQGNAVYVHSKHSIVDDVWMSIGSANLGSRSLTFDGEINAAIIGNSLYKGGLSLISNHRIEICRQLLGLPQAYSALLQDPYATFRLFKAIEQQQESYSFRLHPQPLHTKWLDPLYKLRVGESAFDSQVDIVATLNFTDPSFLFLTCNALDPDGRSNSPTRLAFLAGIGGVGKTVPSATANIGFSFSAGAEATVKTAITAGNKIHLLVKMIITVQTEGGPLDAGPFVVSDYPLKISTTTNNIVLDSDNVTNIITFPISITEKYTARFEIQDVTTVTPGTVLFTAEESFDPATASPVIVHGSVRNVTLIF